MGLIMKAPSQSACEWISDHYSRYEEEMDLDLALENFYQTILDLKEKKPKIYQFVMGTMLTNYFEEYVNNQYGDITILKMIQTEDLDTIIEYLMMDSEQFADMLEISLLKYDEKTSDENEWLYRNMISRGYEFIYQKFNPFYSIEKMAHEFNFPTKREKKIEHEFCDYCDELKETLEYPEHIFYVLTDLLQNKWEISYSNVIMEYLIKSDYYFLKGKQVMDEKTLTKEEEKLIGTIEQERYLEDAVITLRTDTPQLTNLVKVFCFYQDHLCDDELFRIHHKEEETQYMKKMPILKKDEK